MENVSRSGNLILPVGLVWLIGVFAGIPSALHRVDTPGKSVTPEVAPAPAYRSSPSAFSRLWEDPLEATGALSYIAFKADSPWKWESVKAEADKPDSTGGSLPAGTRAVFVLTKGSRYPDVAEWRRQQRFALQAALWNERYFPVHADKLHYHDVSFGTVFGMDLPNDKPEVTPGKEWYLRVPYEDFRRESEKAAQCRLFYVNLDLVGKDLIGAIARMATALGVAHLPLSATSPPSSDWLRCMLPSEPLADSVAPPTLRLDIYNTLATANIPEIAQKPEWDMKIRASSEELITVKVHQLITNDEEAFRLLNQEFEHRGLDIGEQHWLWGGPCSYVVLSEWETTFGRKFAEDERKKTESGDRVETEQELLSYSYLRGLNGLPPDGRVSGPVQQIRIPGETIREARTPGEALSKSIEAAPLPTPFGMSQYDYMARLGEFLKRLDWQKRTRGHGTIRAIGVIGTDVNDKLALLRVLRPRFPDAMFFTNELHAEFMQPENSPFTRNLIVATHYSLDGSELKRERPHADWPPFRTSSQPAIMESMWAALGKPPVKQRPVQLYEIGLVQAHKLETGTQKASGGLLLRGINALKGVGHFIESKALRRGGLPFSLIVLCGFVLVPALIIIGFRFCMWGPDTLRTWREKRQLASEEKRDPVKRATVRDWIKRQFESIKTVKPATVRDWFKRQFESIKTVKPATVRDWFKRQFESIKTLPAVLHLNFLLGPRRPQFDAKKLKRMRSKAGKPFYDSTSSALEVARSWPQFVVAVVLLGLAWWSMGLPSGRSILIICCCIAAAWMFARPQQKHQDMAWPVFFGGVLIALFGVACNYAFSAEGEPFALADGVSLWSGVVLRMTATILALMAVRWGWEHLCNLRDALTKHFFLEREGGVRGGPKMDLMPPVLNIQKEANGLVPRYFPKHSDLDQGSNPAALKPVDAVNEAEQWEKYLKDSDPTEVPVRLRWIRLTFVGLFLTAGAMALADFPQANARGDAAKWADVLSLFFALSALSVLCVFVGEQIWQCRKLIQRIWAHGTTGFGFETEEALFLIARLTSGVGDLLSFPFAVCFVLLCAHSNLIEKWMGLNGLYAMLALALGSVMWLAWKMQRAAHQARSQTIAYLQLNLVEATWMKRLVLQRLDFSGKYGTTETSWWLYTLRRLGRHVTLPEQVRTLEVFTAWRSELIPAIKKVDPDYQGNTRTLGLGEIESGEHLKAARADDVAFHNARISRIQELISLVKSIREGAFGGIQDNPIIKGILIPSVGLGSLELIHRLMAR